MGAGDQSSARRCTLAPRRKSVRRTPTRSCAGAPRSLPDDLVGIEMVCLQVGGVKAGELGRRGGRAQVRVEEGEAVGVDHRVLLDDGQRRVPDQG